MRRLVRAVECVAVMLLLACAGERTAETVESDTSGAPAPTARDTAPAPAPAGAEDVMSVEATLSEWRIVLTRDTVPAGLVSFRVRNTGTRVHRFEIEGNDEEVATDDLQAGDEVTVSLNLTPGTYQIYCPIEAGGQSHAQLGMRTALHVR